MEDLETFSVTNNAIKAIRAALEKRKTPGAALRVGAKGGGCSGYRYVLEFCDDEANKNDLSFMFDDITVFIDKKSIVLLNGTELDYEETKLKKGFKFNNPLVKSSCGCKESFSVD